MTYKIPEILGIGKDVGPAINLAKSYAVAIEREIKFSGKNLEVFEMGPSGLNIILRLKEGWKASKIPTTAKDPDKVYWMIEIDKRIGDVHDLQIGASIRIGLDLDYINFSISRVSSPEGNFGFYEILAQQI